MRDTRRRTARWQIERERRIDGGSSSSSSSSGGGGRGGGGDAAGESSRSPSVQAVNPPVRSRTAGVECGEWGSGQGGLVKEERNKEEEEQERGRRTKMVY